MSENQAEHDIGTMCRVLEISRSGYYAWKGRGVSKRAVSDAALLARIRSIHEDSRGTYGAPRIHAELKDAGIFVGRRRVARLMREAGLVGVSRRRFVKTTSRSPDQHAAPDLVKRDFTANQLRGALYRARDKANLPLVKRGLTFHDLRHTAASWMVGAGISIFDVAKVLGHEDVKTTMRYAHFAPEAGQHVADTMERVWEQVDATRAPAKDSETRKKQASAGG